MKRFSNIFSFGISDRACRHTLYVGGQDRYMRDICVPSRIINWLFMLLLECIACNYIHLLLCIIWRGRPVLEVVSDWSSQNITSCCKRVYRTYIWRVSSRMCCPLAIKFDKAWIFEMKKEEGKEKERNVVVLGLLSYSEPVSFFLLLSTRRRFINGLANHDD